MKSNNLLPALQGRDEEIGRLCREIIMLRSVLKAVEWVGDPEDKAWCPECWRYEDKGHKPGCALHAALNRKTKKGMKP